MNGRTIKTADAIALFWKGPKLARIGMLMIIPAIVSGAFFYFVVNRDGSPFKAIDYAEIIEDGKPVTGIVTGSKIDAGQHENQPVLVDIHYEFEQKDGWYQDRYIAVFSEESVGYDRGDRINLKLLNNFTAVEGLQPFNQAMPIPFFFYFIPIACFLLALVSLLVTIYAARKRISLYKNGKVNPATIVSMSYLNSKEKDCSLLVHYHYSDLFGTKTFGYSEANPALAGERKTGDPVFILVSEDDSDSCVIPLKLALRNNWNLAP